MITRNALLPSLLAGVLAVCAIPAVAAEKTIDLHAEMVGKMSGACQVDSTMLARMEPRMVVVHAVIDQTSLPVGGARARVLQPLLGGMKSGALLPMVHRQGLVKGNEYLISMYRQGSIFVVDRALKCQRQT